MKRGIIIGIAIVVVLMIVFGVYFGSVDEGGILGTLKPTWNIFSDNMIGKGYGECVVDSDCGYPLRIEGEKKCRGSNIVQEVTQKMCDVGKCVERVFSQVVGRASVCNTCDDSSGEPKFIVIGDKTSCIIEGGNKGLCFGGECKSLSMVFDSQPCGDGYCVSGQTCYGRETNSPVCCDDKTETPNSEINLLYQLVLPIRLYNKVSPKELKTIKDLSKKYDLDSIPQVTLAKSANMGKNRGYIFNLNKRYIELSTEVIFLEGRSMLGFGSEELKTKKEELGVISKELEPYKIDKDEWQYLPQLIGFESECNAKNINMEKVDLVFNTLEQIKEDYGRENFKNYFCKRKEEYSCESEGKQTCPGTLGDVCCPVSGPGSVCIKYSGTVHSIFSQLNEMLPGKENRPSIPEMSFGACGNPSVLVGDDGIKEIDIDKIPYSQDREKMKEQICLSQKLTYCSDGNVPGKDVGGVICCDAGEECVEAEALSLLPSVFLYQPPFCQPDSCGESFNACVSNGRRICCKNGVESCVIGPSNSLSCVNYHEIIEAASKTFSTSVYMIRSADDFSLNGKAYVISPHVEFEKEVEVIVSDEVKEGEEVYKYQEHDAVLESCLSSELERVTKGIGSDGGVISLERIKLDVPSGALGTEVEFTITSYELNDCYEVGITKVNEGFKLSNEFQEEISKMIKNENNRFVGGIVSLGIIILLILAILFRKQLFKKRA